MADHSSSSRSQQQHPPALGDEAELYRQFSRILVGVVTKRVNTTPEIVEDACAYAWMQFVRLQPDRERPWRQWLVTVAEREAWARHREMVADVRNVVVRPDGEELEREPPDRIDRTEQYLGALDALEALAQVPERRRRALALHVLGYTYDEVGEMLGIHRTRASHLIREANAVVREIHDQAREEMQPRSPRAARLQELVSNPPAWLLGAIGHPGQRGRAERQLAWRAAALAIDDFRREHLPDATENVLATRPSDPRAARAFDLAVQKVERIETVSERSIER